MSFENEKFFLNRACTWKELGGKVIVLQSETRPPLTHELNETGTFVWKLLDKSEYSLDEITHSIMKDFDIDSETAKDDVKALLECLIQYKLIRKSLA